MIVRPFFGDNGNDFWIVFIPLRLLVDLGVAVVGVVRPVERFRERVCMVARLYRLNKNAISGFSVAEYRSTKRPVMALLRRITYSVVQTSHCKRLAQNHLDH